jgi:NAD(P)-dependent dehydrogenase (short-subunit alcohol dehydrogenase family)
VKLQRARPGGWTESDIPDQPDVSVVVTGANSGIGKETARILAGRGADVVLAVRDPEKGRAAAADITADHPDAKLTVGHLDLADLSSVHSFARWIDDRDLPVEVLVNNAGIMAVPRSTTVDGFETQLGVNHLGHFALTGLLLRRLLLHERPRIVTVTSLAHRRGHIAFDDLMSTRSYRRTEAYRQSKLANILFAMELHRRLRRAGREGAVSVAAHPGGAATNLTAAMTSNPRIGRLIDLANGPAHRFIQSAADGALPVLRAATDPDARGGTLYGPAGFAELGGPAVEGRPSPRALDVHDARALWERSVELTGVDYSALDW